MKWWAFARRRLLQDLRFALRQLRKNPGFGITAILILALGMGVSVAIFGFVDAALLQPLPYSAPDRLMSVDESSATLPALESLSMTTTRTGSG